jgi:hypothetical protein
MAKTMCEVGKQKKNKRMEKPRHYKCRKCGTKVEKKSWVCKPEKI